MELLQNMLLACISISFLIFSVMLLALTPAPAIYKKKSEKLIKVVNCRILKGLQQNIFQVKIGMNKVDAESLIFENFQFQLPEEYQHIKIWPPEVKIEKKYENYTEAETKENILYDVKGSYSVYNRRGTGYLYEKNITVLIDFVDNKVNAIDYSKRS